ncbi:MAG: hypothetical protein Q4Q22_08125 [Methanosphaera sp.]|nr:hypothetical protein [Methanosphaera sp.]
MDTFFQSLRDIQKKERATGTLSEVDEGFYGDASKYLQDLLKIVNDNPLSLEAYQLRDAQRITSEICERREVKIITSAITNVQRSHNLFKGHQKDSQLYDEIPYNATPEEEQLYREVVDKLISYREGLISNITPQKKKTNKIGFKPTKSDKEDVIKQSVSGSDVSGGDVSNQSVPRTDVSDDVSNRNVPKDELLETSDSVYTKSNVNQEDITDTNGEDSLIKEAVKDKKPKKLDASQVMAMFGQAPDDVLLDEENNPVKQKSSASVTKASEESIIQNQTISSGDNSNAELSDENNSSSTTLADSTISTHESEDNTLDSTGTKDITSVSTDEDKDIISTSKGEIKNTSTIEENDSASDSQVTTGDDINVEDSLDNEELVEFVNILPTDVLDENELTYGPFDVQDMALLPRSIVRILKNNNVINIIK